MITPVEDDKQLACFCASPGLPVLTPETVARHKPEARWVLVNGHGDAVARCSLWWQAVPAYPNQRLGLIGHYGAVDAESARQLLAFACAELAVRGCTMAVGPMDGSTWQPYRLVTKRGRERPFFLEPDTPDDWPAQFFDSGFTVLARYSSALNLELNRPNPRLAPVAARAASRGITLRPLNLDCVESELRRLYRIAIASFVGNFLYTPISEADFMALYRPLQPCIQPDLILIAARRGRPVGFIFALPDLLQARRGQAIDTVILKTVAVHPDHRTGGLGSLLVARCQEIAHALGYRRAIHALMHEQNDSRKISGRTQARIFRRYALFAKELKGLSRRL